MRRNRISNSFTDHCKARQCLCFPWLMMVILAELCFVSGVYHIFIAELKFPVFTANWTMGAICLLYAILTAAWVEKLIEIIFSEVIPLTAEELQRDNIFIIHDVRFNGISDITLLCTCKALGDTQFSIMLDFESLYTITSFRQASRQTPSTFKTTSQGYRYMNISPEMVTLDKLHYLLSKVDPLADPTWLRFCQANSANLNENGVKILTANYRIPASPAQLCVGTNSPCHEDSNGAILFVNRQYEKHNAGCTIGFIPTGQPDCGFIPAMVRRFLVENPTWNLYQSSVSGYASNEKDCWKPWNNGILHRHMLYIFRKEREDTPPTDATDSTSEAVSPPECEGCAEGDESHHVS